MIRLLLMILSIIFIAACSNKNKVENFESSFPASRHLTSIECLDSSFIWGRPWLIHYSDSSIIAYDDIGDSIFTLLNLRNDSVIRFGRKGEGVNEFLQPFSFHNIASDSLIGVYDMYKHVLVGLNLRQVKRGTMEFPVVMKDTLNSIDICPTKFDTYVGLGFYEYNMLSLNGKNIGRKFFFEYPYKDEQEKHISNRLRGMAYQGVFRSNRSLDRMLFAVRSAPIFFLYSIDRERIVETYKFVGNYPVYKTEENKSGRSAPMSAKNKMAFIDAYATDKYIYLLYSGKSYEEVGMKCFNGNVIYQMTWLGKPVCKYELDVPISIFCVSDSDDMIYAFAAKGEATLVKIPLKK